MTRRATASANPVVGVRESGPLAKLLSSGYLAGGAASQSLTLTLGACIESHTEVGGVLVPWCESKMLAVGVVARLGYIVLARESGRGGEMAVAAVLLALVARVTLLSLARSCSWATRPSRAAT